jgi:hypothetical protein
MIRPMPNLHRLLVFASLLGFASPAGAVNRFFVENKELRVGATDQTLTLCCDNDVDAYGLSLTFVYEPAKIRVKAIALAEEAAGAGWSDLKYDNATGVVIVGIVMDITNPLTTFIGHGTNRRLVRITFDVLAASPTTTLIDYQNRPARVDGTEIRNILTDGSAASVSPTLEDKTIQITDTKPRILSFLENSGRAGKNFFATCDNLDLPGITIRVWVCNKELVRDADDGFSLLGTETLSIIAPTCGTGGWAPVKVQTENGNDTATQGFDYAALLPPSITSMTGNEGSAGTVFRVNGQNFNRGTLTVKVGGKTALFTLLADTTKLDVTAPAGGSGWAALEICNPDGCDSETNGFHYIASGTPFVRGDANGDGDVDLSDPIAILGDLFLGDPADAQCRDALDSDDSGQLDITDAIKILNFLFLGASPPVDPYPDPGLDTTADGIPSC